jgi:CRISPR-associated endoribonuclease Cas6
MRKGDIKTLLISSPDHGLVYMLNRRLAETIEDKELVNVGEASFRIQEVRILKPRLRRSCRIIAGTPIVIRIPKEDYKRYKIKPPRDYNYVYWRKQYPLGAFIKQLEDNLFKKYNDFHNSSLDCFQLFEQFVFKKHVCNHVVIRGREVKVLGSIWEFIFSYLNEEQIKILQFGLDCGFGELNSMGFGFMNVIEEPTTPRLKAGASMGDFYDNQH